jgi:hypothetical protein
VNRALAVEGIGSFFLFATARHWSNRCPRASRSISLAPMFFIARMTGAIVASFFGRMIFEAPANSKRHFPYSNNITE